jgi:hypothetical protein
MLQGNFDTRSWVCFGGFSAAIRGFPGKTSGEAGNNLLLLEIFYQKANIRKSLFRKVLRIQEIVPISTIRQKSEIKSISEPLLIMGRRPTPSNRIYQPMISENTPHFWN